jgi:hypothetical protein
MPTWFALAHIPVCIIVMVGRGVNTAINLIID